MCVCRFTSVSYTKGLVIQNQGPPLPPEVTYLSTFAGSILLAVTWAAFYPGLVFDRTAADCTMGTSSGFCTADRVMADVAVIKTMTEDAVNFNAARVQAEETKAAAVDIAYHVNNYTCTESILNETSGVACPLYGTHLLHPFSLLRSPSLFSAS